MDSTGGHQQAVSTSADADQLERDWQCQLALTTVAGVGPGLRRALLMQFGTAERVFNAAPSQLREVPGVGPNVTRAIGQTAVEEVVSRCMADCREHQIDILLEGDANYPRGLAEIPDPPGCLSVQGNLAHQDQMAIAIVGTRHCTSYGKRQAARLSRSLARAGMTIVSGLARGIDGAAHQSALDAGGRTIAVLAAGLGEIYPMEHRELAFDIRQQGCLIAESPPGAKLARGSFPRRNRIISGMSLGVLVVEAPLRSGALITARHAMEQGRDVFAVPGPIDSRASRGCHELIRDGAKLVESSADVLDELGPLVAETAHPDGSVLRHPAELLLNDQELAVLQCIDKSPTNIDVVVRQSELPVHRVLATISVLEMRQLIRRVSGQTVVRI